MVWILLSFIYAIIVAIFRETVGRRAVTDWFARKPVAIQITHWILALPAIILTIFAVGSVPWAIVNELWKTEPVQAFLEKLGRMFSKAFQEIPRFFQNSFELAWNSSPPIVVAQILGIVLIVILVIKALTRTLEFQDSTKEEAQKSSFEHKLSQVWVWFDTAIYAGVGFGVLALVLAIVLMVIVFLFFCPSC